MSTTAACAWSKALSTKSALEDDPAEWKLYLMQLGMITYTYAIIETAVDFAVTISFNHLGGNKLQSKMPRHIEASITFLHKCFKDLPKLAASKARGLDILSRVEATLADRHFYVHAVAGDELRKIVRRKDSYGTEARKLDIMEMQRFAATLAQLSNDAAFYIRDDLLPLMPSR